MVDVGSVLGGRYDLKAIVDAGGYGTVWQALDREQHTIVAVKTYDSNGHDDAFGPRYVAENRPLRAIADPGVVPILADGFDRAVAWAAMPLLVGVSVRTRLAQVGALAPDVAMAWLGQAATALAAVHRVGVVHRGLCPARLFVRADERIVLTEFGLPASWIRSLRQLPNGLHPLSARFASYLSPEDAKGEQPTPQSDVYQLGVIAYECLAGRPPFLTDNPLEVAMLHVRQEPPPLPDEVPDLVRHIVSRCLAKSPAGRWDSAAALARAAAGY